MLTPLITMLLLVDPDLQQRASTAATKCEESLAQADKVWHEKPNEALGKANEALNLAEPVRDEMDALAKTSPKEAAALKKPRNRLNACVRAADFVIVEVAHQAAGPDERATLEEYVQRYPKEPSTKTVQQWLKQLPVAKE
jgi:hypothetical protein